jgi:hypothetical protein
MKDSSLAITLAVHRFKVCRLDFVKEIIEQVSIHIIYKNQEGLNVAKAFKKTL